MSIYFIATPQLLQRFEAQQAEGNLHNRAYLRALADAFDAAERFEDPEAKGEMKTHLRVSEKCAASMAAMLRGIAEEGC